MANRQIYQLNLAGSIDPSDVIGKQITDGSTEAEKITVADLQNQIGGVQGITGFGVDNTDPLNPVVNKYEVDSTVTSTGTTYSDAYQITKATTIVTNVAGVLSGVKLPTSNGINDTYYVMNGSPANPIIIYSNNGGSSGKMLINGVTPVSSFIPIPNFLYKIIWTGFYWFVNQEQAAPYKVYAALLSQTGTSAPTASVLQNTLEGSTTFTRSVAGLYTIENSAFAFGSANTTFIVNPYSTYRSGANYATVKVSFSNSGQISIETLLNGVDADSNILFTNYPVEIRVYN